MDMANVTKSIQEVKADAGYAVQVARDTQHRVEDAEADLEHFRVDSSPEYITRDSPNKKVEAKGEQHVSKALHSPSGHTQARPQRGE
eukprot:8408483-Pyramimonas_sp.AAC.1